uniref:Uncharacterized protein n=1 Tax=Arundo donax TaxID=35708 RepID=A0A0A9G9J3_ARUDO
MDMGPYQMGTTKTMTTPANTATWWSYFSLLAQLHLSCSSILCTDFLAMLGDGATQRCTRLLINTAPSPLDINVWLRNS